MGLGRNKISRIVLPAAGLLLLLLLSGWGSDGHKIINGGAAMFLPPTMGAFIDQSSFLVQHASDADYRKGNTDYLLPYILQEGPRHFIDIDAYPAFATHSVPENFATLVAQNDSATVFDIGIVPWAAVWTLDSLTAQLKRTDWNAVWQSAADLGHYVGDAHQPLHATKDYNGRSSLSGSSGIHSRYESTMVGTYRNELSIHTDSIHYISNPIDFMFGIVYQSNSYVDSVYAADVYARQVSGWNGKNTIPVAYTSTLWDKTKGFTQLQLQRAAQNFASLLYTAWVNAGSPNLTGVPLASSSSSIPQGASLEQNFPNPFNPGTTIVYRLPEAARIRLTVYSLRGEQVAVLSEAFVPPGTHRQVFDASAYSLASGVYFYRLEVSGSRNRYTLSDKMIYLK